MSNYRIETNQPYYILSNKNTTFLVIRDLNFEKRRNIEIKDKKNFTLVFDFENLSKILDIEKVAKFISNNNIPSNLIIKNCLIE